MFKKLAFFFGFVLVGFLMAPFSHLLAQQKLDRLNQERALQMLKDAYDNVRKNYYDPKIRGLDWDSSYRQHQEKIRKAVTLGNAFSAVAGLLEALDDSHTFFNPPSRPMRMDYGFRMQIFGDKALIVRVRPGTDAASKVHPGDEVLQYNSYPVHRDDLWKMNYYFNRLSPKSASRLQLRDLNGTERDLTVETKMRQEKRVMNLTGSDGGSDLWQMIREEENADHIVRNKYFELGDVMIWKMPEFDLSDESVDNLFSFAKKHKSLILDLRGNPGGLVKTLERMVANVFDHDVKIADRIGRKELKPQMAKSRGNKAFSGKIIVLVDSQSASAAELFARVMQLEQRGTVIGDRTSGSVMEALYLGGSQGTDTMIFYGFSVTDADLIMKDGKSLEHSGVVPDEILLPAAKDIAEGKDPVLAHAAELVGLKMDSTEAGKMFPFEWIPF
ncbi:MAG TPA: S41 family peptidase [Candidatus Dormibacteraeota bacterium]|nr:S41 family peptidase [Candidatus Dormibacteraeota bacterium]